MQDLKSPEQKQLHGYPPVQCGLGGFFVPVTHALQPKGITHMSKTKLSVRVNRKNKNHHLWNNNGTWWCHLTLHNAGYTAERHRLSLNTRDLPEARQRRDKLLAELAGKSFRGEVNP